jgi:TPR repeat protein
LRGHARAQRHIARRLAEGEGVPRDKVAALTWALIAAKQGIVESAALAEKLRADMGAAQITEAEARAASFRSR